MMARNPNWWSQAQQSSSASSSPSPCPSLFPQYTAASFSLPSNSLADDHHGFPQSWSQLLMGGVAGEEEDKFGQGHYQSRKLENWEDRILNPSCSRVDEFPTCRPSWSQVVMPVSSPGSCVTSLGSNVLDFSNNNGDERSQHPDHSSECNSTATGGVAKKARIQSFPTQPPLKVRKEKLGDRIRALHQIVSPFGKTDTASVLFEAIGYVRFLHGQIEALSSPYMGNASANTRPQQLVQGGRDFTFHEDSSQELMDNCLKRRGTSKQGNQREPKELRSKGLCLVPVSCTHHVGSTDHNGADYWAPGF